MEAEAVLLVLQHIEIGEWEWITSEIVNFEIRQTPDAERQTQIRLLTRHADHVIMLDEAIINRADALRQRGFHTYDALHIACAESANLTVFLTTDDRLLKLAKRHNSYLYIAVKNPLAWLQEVTA